MQLKVETLRIIRIFGIFDETIQLEVVTYIHVVTIYSWPGDQNITNVLSDYWNICCCNSARAENRPVKLGSGWCRVVQALIAAEPCTASR